ncbi:adenosylcobinamide-GDP ribazoletransferase [Candidatus Entotheonella palauensis]|uniref:adenosylcobinamide-GDP ribazoletransferase n=1 Tax=Candidatus Entotheonella palauensis TaxID=93172 RepID=UPI0015C49476|nr:adenosylcobinamide-GDP ribazoletransferase [Candidatus Entotheonella palauensis]
MRFVTVDGLWRAIGVLTVYPLRETESWTPETVGSAMVYYPLVGTLIGISLWMLYVLLSALFAPPIVHVLLIAGLVLITGGLHLNSLANTVDGLNRGHSREDILQILKDIHVGTIAVAVVMLMVLLKYACLGQLSGDEVLTALILMATLSRYAMVQMACFSPYALASGSLGEPFVRGVRHEHFRTTLLLTFLLVWGFGGTRGLLIGCLVALATLGYQAYCVRRLGGITADVLGATNEVNESLVLILMTMV